MDRLSLSPPMNGVAEVTLIGGPHGYGESVVIHLGNGEWIVVDSCVDPSTKECLPLLYLSKIGVDIEKNLRYVICTHWHSDHIAGLSQLIEKCSSDVVFVLSCAEDREKTAYEFASNYDYTGKSKVLKELRDTFTLVSNKKIKVKRVEQDKLIFRIGKVQSFALSPSEFEVRQFETNLAGAMNRYLKLFDEIYKKDQNALQIIEEAEDIQQEFYESIEQRMDEKGTDEDVVTETIRELNEFKDANKVENNNRCVAMLISFGSHHVVLGADLEVSCMDSGWHSVLNCECMNSVKANMLKIPHHGSKSGYLREFLTQHIEPQATAKLSTWMGGSRTLPKADVLKDYYKHTTNLFITNDNLLRYKNTEEDRSIRKIMDEKTEEIIEVVPRLGVIQSRIQIDSDCDEWKTEVFGSATKLTDSMLQFLV